MCEPPLAFYSEKSGLEAPKAETSGRSLTVQRLQKATESSRLGVASLMSRRRPISAHPRLTGSRSRTNKVQDASVAVDSQETTDSFTQCAERLERGTKSDSALPTGPRRASAPAQVDADALGACDKPIGEPTTAKSVPAVLGCVAAKLPKLQRVTSPNDSNPDCARQSHRSAGSSDGEKSDGKVSRKITIRSQPAGYENPGRRTSYTHEAHMQDPTLAAIRIGMLTASRSEDSLIVETKTGLERMMTVFGFASDLKVDWKEGMLRHVAQSMSFKVWCSMVIIGNAVYVGWETNWTAEMRYRTYLGEPAQELSRAPERAFLCWFLLELLLRLWAERREFLFGEDVWWNLTDVVLVLFSLIGEIWSGTVMNSSTWSYIRIFRVFRLIRVIRVVRAIKPLRALRTMVFALLNSFISLLWAFAMIFLIKFAFAVIFCNVAAEDFRTLAEQPLYSHSEDVRAHAEDIRSYYGTLHESMVTLFTSITGGNDWMMYADPLRKDSIGESYFILFAFYIAFCLVGMLNVVTGIFVDSAVCTRTQDEVVDNFREELRRTTLEVKEIFKAADTDGSGTMSLEEFRKHMQTPWVRAYFSGLEIDPSEVLSIFTLLDRNGSNQVDIDEFVNGTMKLKGHAKSVDMLAMMYDSARFQPKFNMFCSYMEDQIMSIRQLVEPSWTPDSKLFHPQAEQSTKVQESLPASMAELRMALPTVVAPGKSKLVKKAKTDELLRKSRKNSFVRGGSLQSMPSVKGGFFSRTKEMTSHTLS